MIESGSIPKIVNYVELQVFHEQTQVDWKKSHIDLKILKIFFQSLNPGEIGTGLVNVHEFTVDQKTETKAVMLYPRSQIFNSHRITWFLNIGNKQATFEEVQKALANIVLKIEELAKAINSFSLKDDNDEEIPNAKDFLFKLITLNCIVDTVAKHGLDKLAQNYLSDNKTEKSSSIKQLGKKAFDQLSEIEKEFTDKLTPFTPKLNDDIILEKCFCWPNRVLKKRAPHIENLRSVKFTFLKGMVLPIALIDDILKSRIHLPYKDKLKKPLMTAANFIKLPQQAQPIPSEKNLIWTPLRVIKNQDGTFNSTVTDCGVVGTVERDDLKSPHLCNLYYHVKNGCIKIGCGALETLLKAEEILNALDYIMTTHEKDITSKRFVIHQHNSFTNEDKLIAGTKISSLFLQNKLTPKNYQIFHINTPFNAAAKLPKEDSRSFNEVNNVSLVQLISLAFDDVNKLLSEEFSTSVDSKNDTNVIKQCLDSENYKNMVRYANQITIAEKELAKRQGKIPSQDSKIQEQINISNENGEEKVIDEDSGQEIDYDDLNENNIINISNEVDDVTLITNETTHNIKQIRNRARKQLKVALQTMSLEIDRIIGTFPNKDDVPTKKGLLILQVVQRLLKTQLKTQTPAPSRCAEIELFLFLYRLLGINVISTCFSGLDRSALARALHGAMSQLENELVDSQNNSMYNEYASLLALEKIFLLITTVDEDRIVLFNLVNHVAYAYKDVINFTEDLKNIDLKKKSTANIRTYLFQQIDTQHPNESRREQLKNVQNYLELVFKNLMVEQEKTIYSTGVLGFNYHYDKMIGSNPHPMDRLPPFVSVEESEELGKLDIQIIKHSLGYIWGSSTSLTKAGKNILSRLSSLRDV